MSARLSGLALLVVLALSSWAHAAGDPAKAAKAARELRRNGHPEAALVVLEQASAPRDPRVLGETIQALLDAGRLEDAQRSAHDLTSEQRGAALPLVIASLRLAALGGATPDVLAGVERSLETAPKHVDLHALRVRMLVQLGRDAEAAQAFDEIPSTMSDVLRRDVEIDLLHERGRRELEDVDRVERAVPRLERALQLDDSRVDVRIDLARALVRFNRNERAEEIVLAGLERDDADTDERLALTSMHGEVCRSMDRLDVARECFDQVLAARPGDIDARIGLARCHLRGGTFDEAAAMLDAVLTERPDHIEAQLVRAEVDLTLREPESAERHLRSLLAARPNHLKAQYMLSRALRLRGEHAEAKVVLEAYQARKEELASR